MNRIRAGSKNNLMMAQMAPENDTITLLPEFFNTIFIGNDIEHETAMEFYRATHYLNLDYPVYIVMNTYGGNLLSALSIRAMIQKLREQTTVYTYCTGVGYSAGSLLMSCGTKGCRYGNPMSSYMIHTVQMYGGTSGNYRTEVSPYLDHVKLLDDIFLNTLSHEITKTKKETISDRAFKRNRNILEKYFHAGDRYLNAEEALSLGIIDKIEILNLPLVILEETELMDGTDEQEQTN